MSRDPRPAPAVMMAERSPKVEAPVAANPRSVPSIPSTAASGSGPSASIASFDLSDGVPLETPKDHWSLRDS